MSVDGSVIIDVLLDKEKFEKEVSDLATVTKQGTLALAGMTAAAAVVTGTIIGTANTAAEAGERIKEMSVRTGLSTTAFQEWDYILSQTGGNIESLGMGMKTMTDKMDAAKSGNEAAVASFSSLGVSVDDLKTKSREDIFAAVVRGLQNTTSESSRASIGADLLGRAYLDLSPTLASSASETEALRQRFYALNFLISGEVIEGGDAYRDQLGEMKKAASKLAIALGSEFMPELTKIMRAVTDFLGQKDNISALVNAIKVGLVVLTAAAVSLGVYTVGLVATNAAAIAATISSTALWAVLAANPITGLVALIAGLVVALVLFSGGLGSLLLTAAKVFSGIMEDAGTCFKALGEWLTKALPQAITSSINYLSNLKNSASDVFSFIIERLKAFGSAAKEWASSFKASAISVIDALKELPDAIMAILSEAWDSFAAGASDMIVKAREMFTKFASACIDAVMNLPQKMYDIGASMVTRLWEGLKAYFDALIEWAKQKYAELTAVLGGSSTVTVNSVSTQSVRSVGVSPSLAPVSSGNSVVFTQNIYSPVSLSPAEIRREAENSLSLWGVK